MRVPRRSCSFASPGLFAHPRRQPSAVATSRRGTVANGSSFTETLKIAGSRNAAWSRRPINDRLSPRASDPAKITRPWEPFRRTVTRALGLIAVTTSSASSRRISSSAASGCGSGVGAGGTLSAGAGASAGPGSGTGAEACCGGRWFRPAATELPGGDNQNRHDQDPKEPKNQRARLKTKPPLGVNAAYTLRLSLAPSRPRIELVYVKLAIETQPGCVDLEKAARCSSQPAAGRSAPPQAHGGTFARILVSASSWVNSSSCRSRASRKLLPISNKSDGIVPRRVPNFHRPVKPRRLLLLGHELEHAEHGDREGSGEREQEG